ncbi:MAG TPA: glycerophosphodiester phosphodiesterase family protein [Flavisolibacter sp.]|nr:glycerophosphodiester phosphodiesterase family protein [Flavisolibacter sp.]
MIRSILKLLSYFFIASCHRILKPPVPDTAWDLFDASTGSPLRSQAREGLEGVYAIEEDKDFGKQAVLKWSASLTGRDTIHYLSIFCKEDATYFICRGKEVNDSILLNGYWRKAMNRETGKARFIIRQTNGTADAGHGQKINKEIIIEGMYGKGNDDPTEKISLKYMRPLYTKTPLEIIAHRGGGRNGDLLPASENSVEIIQLASRLGATGVEIDVQQTRDGVLVLYHDERINDRLTHKTGIRGKLKEYSYAELASQVHLKNGEKIPTLEEALDTIIHKTDLRYVWLDVKDTGYLQKIKELQAKAMKAAAAVGRKIEITVGINSEELFKEFKTLSGYQTIPSLCELDPQYATAMNARIWARMWTEGLQKEDVQKMQATGRRVFVWTIDGDKQITEFMNEGDYDGVVSNHPSLVAYHYYSKQ